MADLIDRDALLKDLRSECPESNVCISDSPCIECIVNSQPAVNHWISCSDMLPEKHGEYLVYFGMCDFHLNDTDAIDKRYYGEKSDGTVGWHSLCSSDITHWMPLPSTVGLT